MSPVETVTVLFTDLVGSTGLGSRVGPAVAEELRREHFAVLRQAIDEHAGREVKNLGDGLMVVFPSAASAVDCAVAMQQQMERRNRSAEEQLGVRIGLSLGDAERDEDDYFGAPVVEAARLCDQAAAGTILTAELVYAMAGVRGQHSFEPAGERELKGLPVPVKTFEVNWEPLGADPAAIPLPGRLAEVPPISYVGRTAEREQLARLSEAAAGGRRRVALLSGEPGIGKTRLATHTALDAHANGAAVLYGRCVEDVGVPYGPWVEAIRHYVKHAPQEVLDAHVQAHGGEITRLARDLTRRVPAAPAPLESDPETERYLLWGAMVGLLEAASERQPVVVILDDLHWADGPTLGLLRHVVAAEPTMGLLLFGTYRESDLASDHPLTELLADLRREQGVERIALSGLEQPDVVSIMEGAAGHEMDEAGLALAHEILGETDGNPFYVAELLRHLSESGAIFQDTDGRWTLRQSMAELGLPPSVREVVSRRVERLGADASKALAVAAVIGRDFDVDLLARVVEREEDELLDLLDEAVAAAVLVESADVTGRFSFAHALVTHTLYEGLGRTRRARIHQRVAESLEEICGEDPGPRLGELARHWSNATQPVDVAKAVDYARRAGRRALDELAPDQALRWLTRALELQPQQAGATAGDRCDLLIDLGEAQRQAGESAFRETLLEAGALARELNDPDRLAAAALANTRGFGASTYGEIDEERVAVMEAALAIMPPEDAATRAQLLVKLAVELNWGGDLPRRTSLVDEALALARRSGDDRTLGMVLSEGSVTTWVPWTLARRVAAAHELTEVAGRLGDPFVQARAAWIGAVVAVEAGDREAADLNLDRANAIAESVGQPTLRWLVGYQRAARAILDGDLELAEQLAGEVAEIGTASGQPDAFMIYGSAILGIRWLQGRAEEVIELVEQTAEDNPGISGFGAALALFYTDLNRMEEAGSRVSAASRTGFENVPQDQVWATTIVIYAMAVAALRDKAAAELLLPMVEPYADQFVWTAATAYGATAHYAGLLADTVGDHVTAQRHFARAAELNEQMGATIFLARTQVAWAQSLLEAAGEGAADQARQLLEAAAETARKHDCGGLERRAAELLSAGAQTARNL